MKTRKAIKNKNHLNSLKTILNKKNQLNKNYKDNKLEFSKEKVNKISQKSSKIKTNLKKKKVSNQLASMKVAKQNQQKNNNQLNPTKTQLKKTINSLKKMPLLHQTNSKL